MKEIEKIAKEYDNDLLKVKKALKSLQSKKCNLQKQKFKSSYEKEMKEVLVKEQILKEVRSLLDPKEKFVTQYEQEDVDRLDFDETIKAIKTIQSKKFHTRYLTEIPEDNDEFRNACRIEKMLLEHKNKIKPVEDTYVRKTDLVTIIDTIKNQELSQERIIELLESLL